MRSIGLAAFGLSLFAAVAMAADDPVADLKSPDQLVRIAAAKKLRKLPQIPSSAVPRVMEYCAAIPDPPTEAVEAPRPGPAVLPPAGEETISVADLENDVEKQVGKRLTAVGRLKLSDSYRGAYKNAKNDHYAFEFRDARGNAMHLYQLRRAHDGAAYLINTLQAGEIAVKIQFDVKQADAESKDVCAYLADVAFLAPDGRTWGPWNHTERYMAFGLWRKIGPSGLTAIIKLLESPEPTTTAKGAALDAIHEMDEKSRRMALTKLRKAGRDADERTKKFLEKSCEFIEGTPEKK